ncbi:MAG: nicotinate-nucleotide adenylyltransferase [Cyclobacteriaceae bacterium]|nr:nicotinate-nucleotide adenylyltransferase [Cyclobacteriaceae bacterium]
MKIGLFFGSFNPIHVGHLAIANIMVETTDFDQVWFVVSPQNPLKNNEELVHEFDRIDMVEAAIYDNTKLRATDIEFNMPKPSYTVDTLAYLSDKYPGYHFSLIIGEDNLRSFPKWKNNEAILANYGLYVYPRPNTETSELKDHPSVKWVKAPLFDISATFIRQMLQRGRSIRYLVPDPVIEIINSRKLYV